MQLRTLYYFVWDTRKNKLHVHVCGNQVRDSFRRGGKSTSEDILGGARIQWAVFNLKGCNSQGGGGTKFSRGGECPPPLNETRQ